MEITIVDFFSFFYRASLARFTNQLSVGDTTTGPLFSLYRSYGYILKNFKNVLFALDGRLAKSVRKSQLSGYKANRESHRRNYQRLGIYEWKDVFFDTVPFFYAVNDAYEADDIIASIVLDLTRGKRKTSGLRINILTVDTDLWQLMEFSAVKVIDIRHKYREVDRDYFSERFKGLKYPALVPLYKAIFGDPSDNIPPAVRKRVRKAQIVDYLNRLREEELSIREIAKRVYKEFQDKFELDLDGLLANLELIKLYSNCTYKVVFNQGSESLYEQTCKKYKFQKVPTFKSFQDYLERNSREITSIFKVEGKEDLADEVL